MRAWGPVTNPRARALASWLCAPWGRHEGARGGRLLPGCGASGVGRSPNPDESCFRACSRGPLPTGCRCGRCGRGDPSPTPQRALLRAGFARCGGGTRAPGGGASCLCVGRPVLGALPPPTTRPFGRAFRAHYPLAVGAGGAGVGTRHQPHSARSCELALRAVGAARGRPRGAPLVWCGASGVGRSPTPDHSSFRACSRGPLPTCCGFGGCRRGEPSPTPQRALLRAGFARCGGGTRAPGGGRLLPGCGASGVGRSPTPDLSSLRACGRGPLPTGRRCGVRAWRPGCPWHLLPCRGSSCVVRASRVRGTRWPLWLGTCTRAVVVAGGVPLWRASWPCVGVPRLVWSSRCRCFGRLSCRRGAFPHPRGCRPRLYWVAARDTWRHSENRALCACRWPLPRQGRWARSALYPFGAPQWGCPWRVPPASVLGCVRCGGLACVDPVTDASGFPYRPSFNGGLGRCTGAVSCGRRHRPFRVGGRHARVPRVCACACPSWPGWAGRPPGRVLVRLTFPVAGFGALFVCLAPSGLGLPCLWLLWGFFFGSPPLPCCAPVVSCFACFPARGALSLGVLLQPRPPLFVFFCVS